MPLNYYNPHSLQYLHCYMDWAIIVSRLLLWNKIVSLAEHKHLIILAMPMLYVFRVVMRWFSSLQPVDSS
jgi:hypothetical protein